MSRAAPSLLRRVLWAVMGAMVLVGLAVLGYDYLDFQQQLHHNPSLQQYSQALVSQLDAVDSVDEARLLVRASVGQTNVHRRDSGLQLDTLVFELRDSAGQTVDKSPLLGPGRLPEAPTLTEWTAPWGAPYWTLSYPGQRWTLHMAEPRVTDVTLLGWMGQNIAPYLLLALPLVALPLWLAVRSGLKPLGQLARHLHHRAPDDLRPLDLPLRHREIQQVGQAFNTLLERLRGHQAREQGFVHDAAHELRTPLAVIATQAHVLAQAATDAERELARQALLQAVDRASHLSRQLLTLASLDRPHPGACQPVDLALQLQQWLALAIPRAQAAGLELGLDAPDSLTVPIDLQALQSIVHNLVDNALLYVPAGGEVLVSLQRVADHIVLCVQDDGPGIPAALQAQVFERFVRGTGHDQPGTGLGLAIVREAAQRLGGQVRLIPGLAGRGVGFEVRWVRVSPGPVH